MPQLRLALAQVNATVGDLAGNADLVVQYCKEAAAQDVHLVVFPEMVLTGYPIEDLAMRASLIKASQAAIEDLAVRLEAEGCGDVVAVVGFLDQAVDIVDGLGIPKNAPLNSVAVIHGGAIVARQAKHHLWNYGVGDEIRNFVAGHTINIIQIGGIDVALAICEDLWRDGPSAAAKAAEAALLVVPNGSPYEADKDDVRLDLCSRRAREATASWRTSISSADRTSSCSTATRSWSTSSARCSAAPASSHPSCWSSTSTCLPRRRRCPDRTSVSGVWRSSARSSALSPTRRTSRAP
ncbi:nitrilase-related carbon-nitrogen hydrolase [Aeromicrobium sp. UC242_57]|uniref:nitrilase-related carbon-nitrogen hydrolase n=1 Tax=Aeromicrobium sp. UC242_57 TaxID=3374624 RepID=UPI0037B040C5